MYWQFWLSHIVYENHIGETLLCSKHPRAIQCSPSIMFTVSGVQHNYEHHRTPPRTTVLWPLYCSLMAELHQMHRAQNSMAVGVLEPLWRRCIWHCVRRTAQLSEYCQTCGWTTGTTVMPVVGSQQQLCSTYRSTAWWLECIMFEWMMHSSTHGQSTVVLVLQLLCCAVLICTILFHNNCAVLQP
jgi:hypothetical protein